MGSDVEGRARGNRVAASGASTFVQTQGTAATDPPDSVLEIVYSYLPSLPFCDSVLCCGPAKEVDSWPRRCLRRLFIAF